MDTRAQRSRRAMLFMPGDDLRKIQKGAGLNVDSIIMDLEDGVAMSEKETARRTISQALKSLNFGDKERLVRINSVASGLMMHDLTTTISGQPDGYVIPKVENANQVAQVANWLTTKEAKYSWTTGKIVLFVIIESAMGVVNVKEIASASPRVVGLMFGAEDLLGDLGGVRTPSLDEVNYARGLVVLHAKAYNLQAIDTPYVDIENLEGLRDEAQAARRMGYDGKLAIHPKHIPIIEEVFTPSTGEVEKAMALIRTHEDFQIRGTGVFTFDGKMIDSPMIRAAKDVLARAGKPVK